MVKRKKYDDVLIIEEPYTCTSCGRQNLKFEEISWKDDKEGQIDNSTVCCKTCSLTSLLPTFLKLVKPGREKDAEKIFKEAIRNFERNYNRRLVRRVVKKRGDVHG